jgi:hypothetical protein
MCKFGNEKNYKKINPIVTFKKCGVGKAAEQ